VLLINLYKRGFSSLVQCKLVIRNYIESDLLGVIAFYNSIRSSNPHFARYEELIKYCIGNNQNRMNMVYIALADRTVTGIAIVAIENTGDLIEGNIIEVESADDLSLKALIKKSIDFCKNNNVDIISFVPPSYLNKAKIFSDWQKLDTSIMMGKALDISSILSIVLSGDTLNSSVLGKKVVLCIEGQNIQLNLNTHTIQRNINDDIDKSDIIVSMSGQIFISLVFGRVNKYMAYLRRRIRIKGTINIPLIFRLLNTLQCKSVSASLGDRM
jgi:hypothetical protein